MYVDLYQVQSLIRLFTNEIFYRRKYSDLRYTKKSSRHRSQLEAYMYMYHAHTTTHNDDKLH